MNTIQVQFVEMLNIRQGMIPYLEYELFDGEFLLVEIQATDVGLEFSFDTNDLPCFFDGQIERTSIHSWLLPYDDCFSLDDHLQMIDQNIRDGYIIAHSLDKFEV